MRTKLIVVSIIAIVLAIGVGVCYWVLRDTKEELAELTGIKEELASTEVELADTEAELTSIEAELAEIEEAHPLRNFDSTSELVSWREETGIVGSFSWMDSCLKLQEIALSDGYILSMDIDVYDYDDNVYASLTAIAGGSFYQVYPDGLEIYYICAVY